MIKQGTSPMSVKKVFVKAKVARLYNSTSPKAPIDRSTPTNFIKSKPIVNETQQNKKQSVISIADQTIQRVVKKIIPSKNLKVPLIANPSQ